MTQKPLCRDQEVMTITFTTLFIVMAFVEYKIIVPKMNKGKIQTASWLIWPS